jgi:hypothetical protein
MKRELQSPRKIAKAAHKIYKKEMQREAIASARVLGNLMKPKPKFIPMYFWMKGLRIFIKVPKSKNRRGMIERIKCRIGRHDTLVDYEGNEVLCRRPGCKRKISL